MQENQKQPIAEITISYGNFMDERSYFNPEDFKKELREYVDIHGLNAVGYHILNDDMPLRYYAEKLFYEEFGDTFPPVNQWQYEKGLSESDKNQFREKLAFIYRQEDAPEFKDARLVSEPDMDNFVISKAFEHLSLGEIGQMVNQRFDRYRLIEQQRAENIIQFAKKYAELHPRRAEQQPPRSIKNKLTDAKIEADRMNAERHAGRTAKQHDLAR